MILGIFYEFFSYQFCTPPLKAFAKFVKALASVGKNSLYIRKILVRRGPTEEDRGVRPRCKYSLSNHHFGRIQREIQIYMFAYKNIRHSVRGAKRSASVHSANVVKTVIRHRFGKPLVLLVKRAYYA